MNSFVVPSSFDPHDAELHAVELPQSFEWDSCARFLREAHSRAVLSRLPLFWQLEPMLHAACKAAGVPICVTDPHNMPVSGAAIAEISSLDTVVTSSEDLEAFVDHLRTNGISFPKNWFVVHPFSKVTKIPTLLEHSGARVHQEVHLSPGIVQKDA
jgi:hypothetical protein